MNILLTNICLRGRTGTEMMTAELALALMRRGHHVAIYSPRLGEMATELRAKGVPVSDHIERLGFSPDVIHGHHNVALAIAMVRFPDVPAIFVCHDTASSYDEAVVTPRIGAYVGVDLACADRLRADGANPGRVHVVPNTVDLSQFLCRETWAERPASALAVTKARAPWLPAVRAACAAAGVRLTEVGTAVGRPVRDLGPLMRQHDIVFAWSRSAAEAAATGAAVVLCDEFGFGDLLTSADAARFPDNALGRRILPLAVTADRVEDAIGRYDAADAERTARIVRDKLSLDDMVARYVALYGLVIDEWNTLRPASAAASLAGFLERTIPRFDLLPDLLMRGQAVADRLVRLDAWLGAGLRSGTNRPQPVSFTRNGMGPALLGPGWAGAEDWGVWTIGAEATLDMPASLISAWGHALAFECGHYFPPADDDAYRAVEVFACGQLLARWTFVPTQPADRDAARREVQVPPTAIEGAMALPLVFRIYSPSRPIDTGGSDDCRPLGLCLRSVGPVA